MLNGLYGSDWNDPKTMATLTMAAGLMSGRNFGDSLGRGLEGYQAVMRNAEDSEARKSERAYTDLVRQMKLEEIKKAQEKERRSSEALRRAFSPVSNAEAIGLPGQLGPTQAKANMVGQPRQVDWQQLIIEGVDPELAKVLAEAPRLGQSKVDRSVKGIGPDGREYEYLVNQYGERVGDGYAQYRSPIEMNMGGRKALLDPYKLNEIAGFDVTMTPAERANNAVAQGNLYMRQLEFQNRPERTVTVMDAGGNAITLPESQASGMPKYSPQAAAQLRKDAESKKARTQMTTALSELKSYYDTLKEGGGIVSQDQGAFGNMVARASSSIPGQTVSGAVGTRNQMTRDKIEQTRPLLLNLIKEATGMSAQQMNSNAEMQLYLRAATDPTLSYEANVQALENLDKLFGLGLGVGAKQVKRTGTYNGRKVIEYTDGSVDYAN